MMRGLCGFLLYVMASLMPAYAADEDLISDMGDFCMEVARHLEAGSVDYFVENFDATELRIQLKFSGGRVFSQKETNTMESAFLKRLRNVSKELNESWDVVNLVRQGDGAGCTLVSQLSQDEEDGGMVGIRLKIAREGNQFLIKDVIMQGGNSLIKNFMEFMVEVIKSDEVISGAYIYSGASIKKVRDFHDFMRAAKSQNNEAIISGYKKIDPSYRELVLIYDIFFAAAKNISNADYMEALKFYKETVPAEKHDLPMLLDYHIETAEYDRVLEILDDIEPFYADGSSLSLIRIIVLRLKGERERMHAELYALLDRQPNNEIAYSTLLLDYAEHNEYGKAVQVLDVLKNVYGYSFDKRMGGSKEHAELARSAEFRQWLRDSKSNKKASD